MGNFTVKKCYKIISDVFESCFQIKKQSSAVNINPIKLL